MRVFNALSIKVDLLGGTCIKDACVQLCDLSSSIGVSVHADFNGVHLIAYPHTSATALYNSFLSVVDSDRTTKIATSRG